MCLEYKHGLAAIGADSSWMAALRRWWTLSGSLIKKFILSALSNMGPWNQALRNPWTQLSRKQCVLVHCLAGRCTSKQVCESYHIGRFCSHSGKSSTVCHQWTRWSSPSMQGSFLTTVSTGLQQAHVCTHNTLWCQHYITTTKKYLTNCHILSEYFELEFFSAKSGENFV